MSLSSLCKHFVVAASACVLVGCDSGTGSGSGGFDSLPPQKQAEVQKSMVDQMTEANQKAMKEQGMQNMPEGVGPKFPDPATYKKGGGQAPSQPKAPPSSGEGGAEKKGD